MFPAPPRPECIAGGGARRDGDCELDAPGGGTGMGADPEVGPREREREFDIMLPAPPLPDERTWFCISSLLFASTSLSYASGPQLIPPAGLDALRLTERAAPGGAPNGEGEVDGGRMLPTPPRPDDTAFAETITSLPRGMDVSSSTCSNNAPSFGFRDIERIFPTPPLPEDANAGRPRDCERFFSDEVEFVVDVESVVSTRLSFVPRLDSESAIESRLDVSPATILLRSSSVQRSRGGLEEQRGCGKYTLYITKSE